MLTTVEIQASRDGVGSSQRRNTDGLFEASSAVNSSAGQRVLEDLAGSAVEFVFDGQQVSRWVVGEADAFGEVVAKQSVGVFVRAALPG